MAVNIAMITMPHMTPAMMGPFRAGTDVLAYTVTVPSGAAAAVEAVPAFWLVGDGVGVELEGTKLDVAVLDVTMLEARAEADVLESAKLGDIVSGHVGRRQASTVQQPVKVLAAQTYH
jgi:hypothetical protein